MDFLLLFIKLIIEACALFYFILILGYWIAWEKIPELSKSAGENKTLVSIVVAARNEEKNIEQCLLHLVKQNYPAHLFEIIIVNDFSEDNTGQVVNSFIAKQENINLRLLNLAEAETMAGGKKQAVDFAVKNAKGELIIMTDADCKMNVGWLKSFADSYEQHNSFFISGPVKFEHSGNILKTWTGIQALEFMSLIGTGAASIRMGYPLMCNAANLAVRKDKFLEASRNIGNEPFSGDDIYLMFAMDKKYPDKISFLKSKDAVVTTRPQSSLTDFFSQRKRWASKVKMYSRGYVKLIGVFLFVFNMLIIGMVFIFLITGMFSDVLIAMILPKVLIDFIFLLRLSRFFEQKKLLFLFPLAEIFHILYIVFITLFSLTGKYEWKRRKIVNLIKQE